MIVTYDRQNIFIIQATSVKGMTQKVPMLIPLCSYHIFIQLRASLLKYKLAFKSLIMSLDHQLLKHLNYKRSLEILL